MLRDREREGVMSTWGSADFEAIRALQKNIERIQQVDMAAFCTECSKEIAKRLLALVIPRTPVGQYPSGSGKVGGTLRRGWTAAENVTVTKEGDTYTVIISNPVEYAPYVEFGHRTRGGGFKDPQFMLTMSEEKLRTIIPKLLERKVKKMLQEVLDA